MLCSLSNIVDDLKDECKTTMMRDSMDLSRIMVHVQQVVESRKRKPTMAWNRSRQAEKNISRKISIEIMDKPRFKKGLSHQGESIFSKGHYVGIMIPQLRETVK